MRSNNVFLFRFTQLGYVRRQKNDECKKKTILKQLTEVSTFLFNIYKLSKSFLPIFTRESYNVLVTVILSVRPSVRHDPAPI